MNSLVSEARSRGEIAIESLNAFEEYYAKHYFKCSWFDAEDSTQTTTIDALFTVLVRDLSMNLEHMTRVAAIPFKRGIICFYVLNESSEISETILGEVPWVCSIREHLKRQTIQTTLKVMETEYISFKERVSREKFDGFLCSIPEGYCSVCLEHQKADMVHIKGCLHVFCRDYIWNSYKMSSSACPQCRQNIIL